MYRSIFMLAVVGLFGVTRSVAEDPPSGFSALFDGNKIVGMKPSRKMSDGAQIRNGILVLGRGGWFYSESYDCAEYELRLRYRLAASVKSADLIFHFNIREGSKEISYYKVTLINNGHLARIDSSENNTSLSYDPQPGERNGQPGGDWTDLRLYMKDGITLVEIGGKRISQIENLPSPGGSFGLTVSGGVLEVEHLFIRSFDEESRKKKDLDMIYNSVDAKIARLESENQRLESEARDVYMKAKFSGINVIDHPDMSREMQKWNSQVENALSNGVSQLLKNRLVEIRQKIEKNQAKLAELRKSKG